MTITKVKDSHSIELSSANGSSPLGAHVNTLLKSPDISRARFLSKLFHQFHLKNAVITEVQGRRICLDGKECINFASANYLGLEQHPKVIEAGVEGLRQFGNHSGCSRIFASHDNISHLENKISELVGAEKTLICANTSHTHQGTISALFCDKNVSLFLDKAAHTSMYQACQIAKAKGAKIIGVDITKLSKLKEQMAADQSAVKVLLVDGVYSMSGTIPPFNKINELCKKTKTILYIDDAHGIGIYGKKGGGVVEEMGLSFENLILVGGLQKGLGSYGGFVSGDAALIDYLRVTSKAYIFSGTLQPQAVEGALAAIEISMSEEGLKLRQSVKKKSEYLRMQLRGMGFEVPLGDSPIIPVEMGSDIRTIMAGRKIYDEGVYLNSVLYPAVPRGKGILRISLTAMHSQEDLDELLTAFRALKDSQAKKKNKFSENSYYIKEVLKSKILGESYSGL